MRLIITLIVLSGSVICLSNGVKILNKVTGSLHKISFIDSMIKFQLFALVIGLHTMGYFFLKYPDTRYFLSFGELKMPAMRERWLGVSGNTSWLITGIQFLLFISLATGLFMFMGLKYSGSLHNFHTWFIPYIILFSITNSFIEEIIFRYGVVAGLGHSYGNTLIMIVSAILFGLPHYFGNPGGVMGAMMSGLLGYILCKATLETKGLAIAWAIHFVQDLIIFSALMMMNIKE